MPTGAGHDLGDRPVGPLPPGRVFRDQPEGEQSLEKQANSLDTSLSSTAEVPVSGTGGTDSQNGRKRSCSGGSVRATSPGATSSASVQGGGLGMGPDEAAPLPQAATRPRSFEPAAGQLAAGSTEAMAAEAPSVSSAAAIPESSRIGGSLPAEPSPVMAPVPASAQASDKEAQEEQAVPPPMATFKEGGLRTTVNTPSAIIDEGDLEDDGPYDTEQYMYYAQQYAQLAEQYAAYAQFCARFAPHAGQDFGSLSSAQQQALVQQLQQVQQTQQTQPSAPLAAPAAAPPPQAPSPLPEGGLEMPQAVRQQERSTSSQAEQLERLTKSSSSSSQAEQPAPLSTNVQDAPNGPTPIIVTPYRHNWLISGNHRVGGPDGAWLEGLKKDFQKSAEILTSVVGSCSSCAPGLLSREKDGEDNGGCKQM
eukprot:TRINITY_DN28265_c0_g1_i1.p1 TRINITY_DN28265_c0_g1~~TRINITY_DN28265_c0_g1_i1.p1  ORF type:complete len:455 (-),score=88.69 TRINITY_DN28265_c0_g1_i1:45-1307(-)